MVVIRKPLCLCHFLIYCRRPCIGFPLLVRLNSHFSLFCWTFGRSIIKHSQRSITRDILCLSRSSAAASACAQSHGKLKKRKKRKSAGHTHAARQAAVTSASRPARKQTPVNHNGVEGGGQEPAILDSKRKSSSHDIKEQERERGREGGRREVRLELKTDDGDDRECEAKTLIGG